MIHPNRKRNRLKDWDYSADGMYFITICTAKRKDHFGSIHTDRACLIPTDMGHIAEVCWADIPRHFPDAVLDAYVIMPNHVHGIIGIARDEEIAITPVGNADLRSLQPYDRSKMTLSKIVHGFKSSVTRAIHTQCEDADFAWQRSFHDRIIRDEDELHRIREYIAANPKNWGHDENNLEAIT